jgi:hypothetical protein
MPISQTGRTLTCCWEIPLHSAVPYFDQEAAMLREQGEREKN